MVPHQFGTCQVCEGPDYAGLELGQSYDNFGTVFIVAVVFIDAADFEKFYLFFGIKMYFLVALMQDTIFIKKFEGSYCTGQAFTLL